MIGKLIDSMGQKRDLDVCTTGVLRVQPKRTQINVVNQ
jgi:hypothetical protein